MFFLTVPPRRNKNKTQNKSKRVGSRGTAASTMYVVKRSTLKQPVRFDKITARIAKLCWGLEHAEPVAVAQKVIQGLYNGVTTTELDELAAQTAAYLSSDQPQYAELAGRLAVSNLHKNTSKSFSQIALKLHRYEHPQRRDIPCPLLSDQVYSFIEANAQYLDDAIIHDRDFLFTYFGIQTLCRSYLLKTHGKVVERPQHMFMRVSCALHVGDLDATIETYNAMSLGMFIHASPTLFNAGLPNGMLSSCFLLTMQSDSVDGIYDTLKQCAMISKGAGGIGLSISNIRATGSYIAGTNGFSNGIVPMLRMYNMSSRYIDQGGQKRKGSCSIYLEPWHADIFEFLEMKKDSGVEELRARDLFYGLWIPDLFMRRVEEDGNWSLFCPNEAPGLADVWGVEFDALYTGYENTVTQDNRPLARECIKARKVWSAICDTQIEKSVPYMLYKDTANAKSNQQHCGTIRCSNLCTEIIEYTSPSEVAVCNLASIALNKFVENGKFNFDMLQKVTKIVVRNLNKVIDVTSYPVSEAHTSNMRHRPLGAGVQGLADAFILMRYPFDSKEAANLNKDIFEAIYFAACEASCELAQKDGPYPSFEGSPMSKGLFQFDLWKTTPSGKFGDWNELRTKIQKYGVRNCLLLAPMPTASTSQILGNNECFEPFTSNLYVRRTLAGEFVCVSKYLVNDLQKLGLWSPQMKNTLISHNGSVQNIAEIPQDLKDLYKTAFEIKSKVIIDMAADRGIYICQSQSMNIYMPNINHAKLTSLHFYAWKKGLKTGMYYLHSKPAADPIKFTVDTTLLQEQQKSVMTAAASLEPVSNDKLYNDGLAKPLQHASTSKRKRAYDAGQQCALFNSPHSNLGAVTELATEENGNKQAESEVLLQQQLRKRRQNELDMICSLENKDQCLSCGS